jgi:hypothetical protein
MMLISVVAISCVFRVKLKIRARSMKFNVFETFCYGASLSLLLSP